MAKGFVYLVAVMDWYSRRVLAWRLSIGMETAFCVEALREAMDRHGPPEVFNTDQGAQFTSADFVGELERRGVRISMDGKGRFLDNIFIERLWRSLKYEDMYITPYVTVSYFRLRHSRSMKMLSRKRPLPSMLDPNAAPLQLAHKIRAGELRPLIGVEHLRRAVPIHRLAQRLDAERRLTRSTAARPAPVG